MPSGSHRPAPRHLHHLASKNGTKGQLMIILALVAGPILYAFAMGLTDAIRQARRERLTQKR